jgi:DNA invertase Pin-like site-specific DNA recombinase
MREAGVRLTNLTDGGEGTLGYTASDDTRAKISASQRGRTHSPEHVAKQAAALRGKRHSAERRAAIAAGIAAKGGRVGRGRRITDQEIANIRATITGREGERAALVRATGWSITTINRALDETRWSVPDTIVGVPIAIDVHDRTASECNGRCSVTVGAVRAIRASHDAGAKVSEIAREFGLSWSQTSRIVRFESWPNVV